MITAMDEHKVLIKTEKGRMDTSRVSFRLIDALEPLPPFKVAMLLDGWQAGVETDEAQRKLRRHFVFFLSSNLLFLSYSFLTFLSFSPSSPSHHLFTFLHHPFFHVSSRLLLFSCC